MPFDSILALEGRVSRRRYLAFLAGAYLVYWAILLLSAFSWRALSHSALIAAPDLAGLPQPARPVGVCLIVIGGAAAIVLFFVTISFAVRRFHDMNLSGDWNWLVIVVAIIPIPALPLPGVSFPLAFLIWHAFLLFYPGTKGRNRFGPAPGEPDTADIAAVFESDAPDRPASRPFQ